MNKTLTYLSFIIFPVLLFITAHILKVVQGPYYLNFYDPSYVYLINSLNLAQLSGYGVGHFDHPGTTVQVIGAIFVKLYYLISNVKVDIATDVISRPEDYLWFANKGFVTINCILLFLLGLFIYKISNNIVLSLLIQLSPFASTEIFYGLIIVTPENFLIAVSLCFIGVLFYYLYKVDDGVKSPLILVIAFAVVCGIGLATKLNFLPMILLPLILIKGFKNKIIFSLFTFVSFIIFVSPALSNYSRFIEWIEKLFLYTGHYGSGDPTIIDSTEFSKDIILIFKTDNLFGITYFIAMGTLIFKFFFKHKTELHDQARFRKEGRVLLGIFLAMTLQIILVAKQYRQHYMIPSFMMCLLSLFLCSSLLSVHLKRIRVQYAYLFLIVIIAFWSLTQIIDSYYEGDEERTQAFRMEKYLKDNCSGELVVPSFGSANKECAIAFAVSYAGSQVGRYQAILSKVQPEHIFYNPWTNEFYLISPDIDIQKILLESKKLILQGRIYSAEKFMETLNKTYNIKNTSFVELLTNGRLETIYQISLENQRNE